MSISVSKRWKRIALVAWDWKVTKHSPAVQLSKPRANLANREYSPSLKHQQSL